MFDKSVKGLAEIIERASWRDRACALDEEVEHPLDKRPYR